MVVSTPTRLIDRRSCATKLRIGPASCCSQIGATSTTVVNPAGSGPLYFTAGRQWNSESRTHSKNPSTPERGFTSVISPMGQPRCAASSCASLRELPVYE
jgi:hypothetical protein